MAVGLQSGCDYCSNTVASNIAYYSHIQFVLAPNGPDGGIGAKLRIEDY